MAQWVKIMYKLCDKFWEELHNNSWQFTPFLRWEAERHECSARCGEGVAKQTVRCVKKTGWREETVSEDQCKGVGHRPGDLVMCSGDCNPAQWQYTEWSRVSSVGIGSFRKSDYFSINIFFLGNIYLQLLIRFINTTPQFFTQVNALLCWPLIYIG